MRCPVCVCYINNCRCGDNALRNELARNMNAIAAIREAERKREDDQPKTPSLISLHQSIAQK